MMNVNKIVHKISLLHSVKEETPTDIELVRKIIDRLDINWADPSLRFIDPVCGRGTFLLGLLEKFEKYGHTRKHIIKNMLYGIDRNRVQHLIAKKSLSMACDVDSNIICGNSLDSSGKVWNMKYDWVVGNYPFNDDSESAGRNTNKVKENTASLDHTFYKFMRERVPNHAVILRSNCLGKDSSVRELIFTDPCVKEIIDTTKYFSVSPDTMCVIRNVGYNSNLKTIVDRDEREFTITTDKDTKLSLTIGSNNIDVVHKIWALAKENNLGHMWNRSPILRKDSDTGSGVDIVPITGDTNKPLEIKKYNGNISKVKHVKKWKVISNVNASRTSIGAIKIVPPDTITSNSVIYFAFDTELEANNCKKYLESEFIRWYTPLMKVSAGNSSEFFAKVPSFDFNKEVTDDVLKSYFTAEEKNLIWI